jgi:hypothetical protein
MSTILGWTGEDIIRTTGQHRSRQTDGKRIARLNTEAERVKEKTHNG